METETATAESNVKKLGLPKEVETIILDKEYTKLQDEWSGLEPTDKEMGIVQLVLDKGVKTTVMGTIYGLDFDLEQDGYSANVFFDHYNKRLKITDYEATDYTAMLQRFSYLAEANGFDKIFVKARKEDFQQFLSRGYIMEGILRYYLNGEDAYVLSRFSSYSRIKSKELINEAKLMENIIYNSSPSLKRKLPKEITIVDAKQEHIPQLVYIYRSVFETYPSPLTNPDYIKAAMKKDVIFKLALDGDVAIAAASAEMNRKYSNAEMTDCATTPQSQGKGLMQFLLTELEKSVREEGIQTVYTLARAQSIGMNKSFFRLDYEFSGRLINNCDIFGQFEDLNIWVKKLN